MFRARRTAREHEARGHFGLPQSSVRASRMRGTVGAVEKIRKALLARELRKGTALESRDAAGTVSDDDEDPASTQGAPSKSDDVEGEPEVRH